MTTRFQRLSATSRRLECGAAAAAVLFAVVMSQLLPDGTAGGVPAASVDGRPGDPARAGQLDRADRQAGQAVGEATGEPTPLPRSRPVHVRIPGTGVDADILGAAQAPASADTEGTPAAPPQRHAMELIWAGAGPSPGETGPSVLVGRMESKKGPAALAGLSGLRPGARVLVSRADDRTAAFEVGDVEEYAKGALPERQVHGETDDPELRLVGRGAEGSVVAYAHLVPGA